MRFSTLFATVVFGAALIGCVATGPEFTPAAPPSNDQTLVYIYRAQSMVGIASNVSFAVDGIAAATLNVEGYTRFYVKSGHRAISVNFSLASFPEQHRAVYFPPGKTLYLKMAMGSSPYGTGTARHYTLGQVDDTIARREILSYKFQSPFREVF